MKNRKRLSGFLQKRTEDFSESSKISFTFEFSITGTYDAWAVECNGKERANGQSKGSFSGIISTGAVLMVIFKVWNGNYSIDYSCKAGGKNMKDENNEPPLTGVAAGPSPSEKIIYIQF
jgi:hypothetical protein